MKLLTAKNTKSGGGSGLDSLQRSGDSSRLNYIFIIVVLVDNNQHDH